MKHISLLILLFSYVLTFSAEPSISEIKWVTVGELQELQKKEPRKVMIDVYTDWCGYCKVMDKNTFTNPVIQRYLGEKYYAVKFNAEQKEVINFKGTDYKYIASGNRGYNELAVSLLNGKLSYPTVVFLNEKLDIIQPIPGYQDPRNLERIIKFFGENAHKNDSWDNFNREHKFEL